MLADLKKYIFFIIAIAVFAAGIAHAVIILTHQSTIKNRVSLDYPKHELTLKPGVYTVFYEYLKTTKKLGPIEFGEFDRIQNLEHRLEFTIQHLKNHNLLKVKSDTSKSYMYHGSVGESLFVFRVIEQGDYIIETSLDHANNDSPLTLTLVTDFNKWFLRIFKTVAIYIAIACCFAVLGLVVVIRTR
ncbi:MULTISPECIES: hypothetical protein [unclassified Paenibacillus]|uniref:hypothetical protein n=1 Tax=unclassified Paenibacillus TaxID=185978 RepID=UPI002F3F9B15